MIIMAPLTLRFSVGMGLAGLAQLRWEKICKQSVGGSISLADSWAESVNLKLTTDLYYLINTWAFSFIIS